MRLRRVQMSFPLEKISSATLMRRSAVLCETVAPTGDGPWWAGGSQEGWRNSRPLAACELPAGLRCRTLVTSSVAEIGIASDTAVTRLPSQFVKTVWELHEDLRACLFLFVEIACVANAATTCKLLLASLWADTAFWRTYGGPCLLSAPRSSCARLMRERFRKWLFRLEGAWVDEFVAFVDASKGSEFGADFRQLLSDAKYIASGLMPHDDVIAVAGFIDIVCRLLNDYSPSQLDERSVAEGLLARIEQRNDVFSQQQAADVAAAFDRSVERCFLEAGMDDRLEDHDLATAGILADDSEGEDEWEPPGMPPPALSDSNSEVGLFHTGDAEAPLAGGHSFWREASDEEEDNHSFWRSSQNQDETEHSFWRPALDEEDSILPIQVVRG